MLPPLHESNRHLRKKGENYNCVHEYIAVGSEPREIPSIINKRDSNMVIKNNSKKEKRLCFYSKAERRVMNNEFEMIHGAFDNQGSNN